MQRYIHSFFLISAFTQGGVERYRLTAQSNPLYGRSRESPLQTEAGSWKGRFVTFGVFFFVLLTLIEAAGIPLVIMSGPTNGKQRACVCVCVINATASWEALT